MISRDSEPLDPVVARTREAREAVAKQCDYDLDKMFDLFRSMQEQHRQRVRAPEGTPHRTTSSP